LACKGLAVRFPSPGEWGPFKIYLPVTWSAPSFDRTFLGFPNIKQNGFGKNLKIPEKKLKIPNLKHLRTQKMILNCMSAFSEFRRAPIS
jgi:hypothetical protein